MSTRSTRSRNGALPPAKVTFAMEQAVVAEASRNKKQAVKLKPKPSVDKKIESRGSKQPQVDASDAREAQQTTSATNKPKTRQKAQVKHSANVQASEEDLASPTPTQSTAAVQGELPELPVEVRQMIVTHLINIVSLEASLDQNFAAHIHRLRSVGYTWSIDCIRPLEHVVDLLEAEWKALTKRLKNGDFLDDHGGQLREARKVTWEEEKHVKAMMRTSDRTGNKAVELKLCEMTRAQAWLRHVIHKTKQQHQARQREGKEA